MSSIGPENPGVPEDAPVSEDSSSVLWAIQPHTVAKHRLLRTYLQRWLPILGRWNNGLNYIDGFAGPGRYLGGEDGSPVMVLDAAISHALRPSSSLYFGFIEARAPRAAHLEALLAQRFKGNLPSGWSYEVMHDEFDQRLPALIDQIEGRGMALAPTFVFIDPFGFSGFPMRTIQRVLGFAHCEVLVTFMSSFVTRFLEEDRAAALTSLFGSDRWREARALSGEERIRFLVNLYEAQIKTASNRVFVRTFEIADKNDRTLYHLVFATTHIRGLEEMKESMWNLGRQGLYRFSDTTGFGQKSILAFEDGSPHQWEEEAANMIASKFTEQTVSEEEIRRFVVASTPYIYRKAVLKLLEDRGSIQSVYPRRRAKTYPDGCQIEFNPLGAI